MGSIISKAHVKLDTPPQRPDPSDETLEDWMNGKRCLGDKDHAQTIADLNRAEEMRRLAFNNPQ